MRNRVLVAIVGLLIGSGFVFSAGPENPPPLPMDAPMSRAQCGPSAGTMTPSGVWIDGEFYFGWFNRGPLPVRRATFGSVADTGSGTPGQSDTEEDRPKTLPGA